MNTYKFHALIFGAIYALTPFGAAHAAEDERTVLKPSSHWQLDMGEHKCRLVRLFGPADDQTIFYLEQWDPSRSADFAVAGGPARKFRHSREAEVAFGPDGATEELMILDATLGEYGQLVSGWSRITHDEEADDTDSATERDWNAMPRGLPSLDADGAEGIHELTIKQRGRDDLSLALGDMKAPLAAMNVCMEDLVGHWGFDLDEQRSIVSPPKITNIEKVVERVQKTYPGKAERRGAQANFHLRLTIAQDGSVAKCVLLNQTLADDFDMKKHPCTAFEELAEIEPAKDAKGNAVSTYYTKRIIYKMRS